MEENWSSHLVYSGQLNAAGVSARNSIERFRLSLGLSLRDGKGFPGLQELTRDKSPGLRVSESDVAKLIKGIKPIEKTFSVRTDSIGTSDAGRPPRPQQDTRAYSSIMEFFIETNRKRLNDRRALLKSLRPKKKRRLSKAAKREKILFIPRPTERPSGIKIRKAPTDRKSEEKPRAVEISESLGKAFSSHPSTGTGGQEGEGIMSLFFGYQAPTDNPPKRGIAGGIFANAAPGLNPGAAGEKEKEELRDAGLEPVTEREVKEMMQNDSSSEALRRLESIYEGALEEMQQSGEIPASIFKSVLYPGQRVRVPMDSKLKIARFFKGLSKDKTLNGQQKEFIVLEEKGWQNGAFQIGIEINHITGEWKKLQRKLRKTF